jgi:amidase
VPTDDVIHLPAVEQVRLLRRRELTSAALVDVYLERIATSNARLSAFVTVFESRARLAARAADRALDRAARRGEVDALPPLLGVPIAVKDLNFVRGSRTRMGSRAVLPLWSPVDDATVAKLRRAGSIVLGKLATSELGALPVTEPDIHPPTRNPWDPSLSAGGSSGGSGAAVAAGLVPWAQGSDGAGSIRIPAAFNGLVGIKASRGRIANAFGRDDRTLLYTCGPLARSVADAAALLDVLAGLHDGRPHWLAPPPCPYSQVIDRPAPRLRIKLTVDSPIGAVDPEWAEATRAVGRALAGAGHHVEEAAMASGSVDDFLPVYQRMLAEVPWVRLGLVQPATRWLIEAGRRISPALVRASFVALRDKIMAWVGDTELVLTPAVVGPPPPVGAWGGDDGEAIFRAAAVYGAFTAPFNVTGQPAIALPVGRSRAGLPIAVQLAAAVGREDLVVAVGREVEGLFPDRPTVPVSKF